MEDQNRNHGGDLDRAIRTYGPGAWLDLSTGINPLAYPVMDMDQTVWSRLPTRSEIGALESAAADAYSSTEAVVALAGAQAAIQLVPRLRNSGRACVVDPTYNEHAGALRAQGWRVEMVTNSKEARGADLLTVVNPNNPDGRVWKPTELLQISEQVGLLVVDESFVDCTPEVSLAPHLSEGHENVVVLRSFGKFFGLAGVRLGFAIASEPLASTIRAFAGPWAVSGPAIAIGRKALSDTTWQVEMRQQLLEASARLDSLANDLGWRLVGGTPLFRTYETPDAQDAQHRLAHGKVWSRRFPYSQSWVRLGLPGTAKDWDQLEMAVSRF